MLAGVTIVDPATTWIDVDVTLEADSEIWPGTQLEGRTVVGAGARIGPGCVLRDTTVAEGATVTHAVCVSAQIGPGASVGPVCLPAARHVARPWCEGGRLRRTQERGRWARLEGATPVLRG